MQSLDKIKIGYTANGLLERKKQMQTGNPHGLVIIGTVKGTMAHELKIHNTLADYRAIGEWFNDCKEVRKYIRDILDKKIKVEDTVTMAISGERITRTTEGPEWLSPFLTYNKIKHEKLCKIVNDVKDTEIEINHLLAKKERLETKYVKIIKGN
tara:strand:+ start:1996 stop:2457 length:462 start_codon:yes stop_codon:yes gene_type:complete